GLVRHRRARLHRVLDPIGPWKRKTALRSERNGLEVTFRALIDEGSRLAIEGPPVEVALAEVLANLRPDLLEGVPEMAHDGVVSEKRVTALERVEEAEAHDRQHREQPPERDLLATR